MQVELLGTYCKAAAVSTSANLTLSRNIYFKDFFLIFNNSGHIE